MKGFAMTAVAAVAITASIAAQKPVPPPATPIPSTRPANKTTEITVAISGCVRGTRLVASQQDVDNGTFAALRATEFVLKGPRELLQQIKDEHDGHYDRIEGIVSMPPSPNGASSTTTSKSFGKTHVTLGGREEGKAYVEDPPKPLTLKVAALTHLHDGCAGQ